MVIPQVLDDAFIDANGCFANVIESRGLDICGLWAAFCCMPNYLRYRVSDVVVFV